MIQLPRKFEPMFKPKRIKCYFGGRGGAKTESFGRIALALMSQGKRFLCLREFLNSIDDSVHNMLKGLIESEGLAGFEALNNEIRHVSGGGAKYGQLARNLSSIKSKFDYDVAWIEEAETVSQDSLDTLLPTIRKGGSEIWLSFNPVREDGAVYASYCVPHMAEIKRAGFYEDGDLYVCKIGLDDNPWAPQVLIDASNKLKAANYDRWLHVYGGEPLRDLTDVIIQPKWVEAAIDAHKKLPHLKPVGVRSIGFDPADEGTDRKAVAMRHGVVVKNINEWQGGGISEAIDRAFSLADDWRAEFVVFDADGLGAAVKVGLDQRLAGRNMSVEPFHGGGKPMHAESLYKDTKSNRDTFKNWRAQAWWLLRDRFEATYNAVVNGEYLDPDLLISLDSEGIESVSALKSELTAPLRKRTNTNQIQLESKQDMLKRGVKSPNMADALAMCFCNSSPTTQVEELNFAGVF